MNLRLTKLGRWSVLLTALALAVLGLSSLATARSLPSDAAAIYLVPHADDEFQVWSMFTDDAVDYRILVVLTRGEETQFCKAESWGNALQEELGELRPEPEPEARWTRACEQARINSLLGFLEQMSQSDDRLPGDFPEATLYQPTPETGQEFCRIDDSEPNCSEEIGHVEVWPDRLGRGAVVQFNLGDGDLTSEGVVWAVELLLEHRADWGLAPEVPARTVVGGFANDGSQPCVAYPHPDHLAVHEALWNVDFGVGPQLGATCALDPRRSITRVVGADAARSAFHLAPDGTRRGAHERHYGWLHRETFPMTLGDGELFHRAQSFWVRFN